MGRTLLLSVIMVTVIFAGIMISLLSKANTMPDMAIRNLDQIALKNTGTFALNFAIKELQNNASLKSSIPTLPAYHTISYNNFDLSEGRIDSIRFTNYTSGDSTQITAFVSKMVNGERKDHTSEARLGTGIGSHENQTGGWHFDETSGNAAGEFANGGFGGTLSDFSNPDNAWQAGKWGNALNFDGSNDHVQMPTQVADTWNEQFSAASWVKLDNSFLDWGTVISEQMDDAGKTLVWALRSRLIDITLFGFTLYSQLTYTFVVNTVGNPPTESVSISKRGSEMNIYDWHFVVVTYDGLYSTTKARIEILIYDEGFSNDTLINKIENHAANTVNNNGITVGGFTEPASPWSFITDLFKCIDGTIDEVNLFNKILDVNELFELYDKNGFGTDKIIYWRP